MTNPEELTHQLSALADTLAKVVNLHRDLAETTRSALERLGERMDALEAQGLSRRVSTAFDWISDLDVRFQRHAADRQVHRTPDLQEALEATPDPFNWARPATPEELAQQRQAAAETEGGPRYPKPQDDPR